MKIKLLCPALWVGKPSDAEVAAANQIKPFSPATTEANVIEALAETMLVPERDGFDL